MQDATDLDDMLAARTIKQQMPPGSAVSRDMTRSYARCTETNARHTSPALPSRPDWTSVEMILS
ncbi:MAG: hypothetical protein ACK5BX_25730 [Bradyrhizobium sp.]